MENENRLVKAREVEEIFNYEVSIAEKDPLDAFDSAIQNSATVDAAEVVHGQWKLSRENEVSKTIWCTNCGEGFYIRKKGELQLDKMPYCPQCGAKMDGDSYDSEGSG